VIADSEQQHMREIEDVQNSRKRKGKAACRGQRNETETTSSRLLIFRKCQETFAALTGEGDLRSWVEKSHRERISRCDTLSQLGIGAGQKHHHGEIGQGKGLRELEVFRKKTKGPKGGTKEEKKRTTSSFLTKLGEERKRNEEVSKKNVQMVRSKGGRKRGDQTWIFAGTQLQRLTGRKRGKNREERKIRLRLIV